MTAITIPQAIRSELDAGAALAVSISGGKDSQALLSAVVRAYRENGWTGELFAIHADLGRAEWGNTMDFVKAEAARYGVRLEIVARAKGDLVDRMKDRAEQLAGTGRPFWPSSSARYCTSDLKRDPIDKALRRYDRVVCAIGLRAEESAARARRPDCQVRTRITTQTRHAMDWHPILTWTQADVWAEIGTSLEDLESRRELHRAGAEDLALAGWPAHPAYVYGNERLSCALCVLASRNDLLNGARYNPAVFQELLALERSTGCSFRKDLALADLEEELRETAAA